MVSSVDSYEHNWMIWCSNVQINTQVFINVSARPEMLELAGNV